MNKEELDELLTYYRLCSYRDEGDILLDEYIELEDIIKRNDRVKTLEEARYQNIMGNLSDESYHKLLEIIDKEIEEAIDKQVLVKKK